MNTQGKMKCHYSTQHLLIADKIVPCNLPKGIIKPTFWRLLQGRHWLLKYQRRFSFCEKYSCTKRCLQMTLLTFHWLVNLVVKHPKKMAGVWVTSQIELFVGISCHSKYGDWQPGSLPDCSPKVIDQANYVKLYDHWKIGWLAKTERCQHACMIPM